MQKKNETDKIKLISLSKEENDTVAENRNLSVRAIRGQMKILFML